MKLAGAAEMLSMPSKEREWAAMLDWIQNVDWTILHWIQDTMQCRTLDFLMPKITLLGSGCVVWLVLATAMTISKKYRQYGITMFAALAAGVLAGNVCMKHLVARARPCWLENIALLVKNPTDYSFPSGHTMLTAISAYVLAAANRKCTLLAGLLVVMIGFSRLYLYVHFPSDVLVGGAIGIGIGAAAVGMMRKRSARKATTAEKVA